MEQYISQEFPDGASVEAAILRAKSGGAIDTALQNKAPAGYGYGEILSMLTASDNDGTVFESMFDAELSKMASGETKQIVFEDYPFLSGYTGVLTLFNRTDGYATVIGAFSEYSGVSDVRKAKIGGTWYPWEWVNPPMLLGKEYRTTERYNGHPVYALRDNFGPNTNGAVMYYGNNVNDVVYGIAQDGSGSTYPWYNRLDTNPWSAWFSFAKGVDPSDSVYKVKVTCFTGSSASGSFSANTILVKYTKTTD